MFTQVFLVFGANFFSMHNVLLVVVVVSKPRHVLYDLRYTVVQIKTITSLLYLLYRIETSTFTSVLRAVQRNTLRQSVQFRTIISL
jgi:hypothetical protein